MQLVGTRAELVRTSPRAIPAGEWRTQQSVVRKQVNEGETAASSFAPRVTRWETTRLNSAAARDRNASAWDDPCPPGWDASADVVVWGGGKMDDGRYMRVW